MPSKVMFFQSEKEMLLPYDSFTQMIYVLGIKFACDHWGVLRNDIFEITTHINPDAVIDNDRVQKSLEDLERTGLIKYIARDNGLMVVEDFGIVNEFGYLKTNKKVHNKESDWVIQIKYAIKSGELNPYFLEIPAVLLAKKQQFIKAYLNGTLKQMTYQKEGMTFKYYDSLMYPEIYHWYQDSKYGDSNEFHK